MTREQTDGSAWLADLCLQAVQRFGYDWARIRAYLSAALDELPEQERQRLDREMRTVLSFHAPTRSGDLH